MRLQLQHLCVVAALVLLTGACGEKTDPPVAPPPDSTTLDQDSVDDGQVGDAAQDVDAAAADVASTDSNLHLNVEWSGKAGYLLVNALPAGEAGGGEPGMGKLVDVFAGPIAQFPVSLDLKMPGGTWMIGIQLISDPKDDDSVVAEATVCSKGKVAPTVVPASGSGSVTLNMKLHTLAEARGNICLADDMVLTKGVAIQKAVVEPPPTDAGGAHLLDTVTIGDRMWIAGYQDGYVSFDFPDGKPVPKLAGWTTYGQFECGRITRSAMNLFCTGRTDRVSAVTLDPQQETVAFKQIEIGKGLFAEGLVAQEGRLWVAVHGGGLRAMSAKPPFDAQLIGQPLPPLKDTWDVAALGSEHLVVADGEYGLRVLQVAGAAADSPKSIGSLPLAGVAAYAHATDNQAVVGALGGGMHIVSLVDPSKPFLQGSVSVEGMVFGVTTVAGMAVGAAGFHLAFVDLPPPSQAAGIPLQVRDVEPSFYFAMDVAVRGGSLLAAEFQAVRLFDVDPNAPIGPLLLAPKAVFVQQTAVGDTIKGTLILSNPGSAPLKVGPIAWSEQADVEPMGKPITKPIQIAPGKTEEVPIAVPKTLKGVVKHGLVLTSNDPSRPDTFVQLIEVSELRPGDSLPPLAYEDGKGKQINVAKYFEGKVGVLLVAAHSCPVAFDGLKTASIDIKGMVASGKVAALAINPWDKPADAPITAQFDAGFPILYSPLTTKDGHDWSEVLDVTLGQPQNIGAPMPVVYVLRPSGQIALAELGYRPGRVLKTIESILVNP